MRSIASTSEPQPVERPRRILIVGEFGFPHGEGGTARVHAYAKGLSAAQCDVEVVCLRPSERRREQAMNRDARGRYEGIPFVYAGGTPYRDSTFAQRRVRDARSALQLCHMVHGASGRGSADVILFSNSAAWVVTAVLACRAAGSRCVLEKSEYPFVNAPRTPRMRLWAWLFTRIVYRLVDGVIVISTCLEGYFARRVRRDARVIRVPILADLDEFSEEHVGDGQGRRVLCYVGNLDHPGEIGCLLDAFCEVAQRFPEWSLRVVGDSRDPSVLGSLRSRAAQRGMADRVEFLGRVPRGTLSSLYREAGAFALPRAGGLFSTAGFPTKLAEYLACGRPVVVTATGDIPLFLRDGVDAFLAPPDDAPAFAARLAEMFGDPDEAHAVGLRGRETARRHFEVVSQCRRLSGFLADLHDTSVAHPGTE